MGQKLEFLLIHFFTLSDVILRIDYLDLCVCVCRERERLILFQHKGMNRIIKHILIL